MNRFRILSVYFSAILVVWSMATLASDTSPKGDTDPVIVAEGRSFRITVDDMVATALAQSPTVQQEMIYSAAKKNALLEKLINMNLLAVEAKRRGYDRNPEVIAVKKNRLATLMHTQIAQQVDGTEPSEEELKAFYDENYAKYNKPEKIRARHILISDKKKAQELLTLLKKENVGQYQFRKVAREESEDKATASRGGDLAFFTRDASQSDIAPEVIEAAYQIHANGELYPQLVKTEAGYHIVMRTGYRKAVDLKYEDARDRIQKLVQRQLHRQKVDEALLSLHKKYSIKLYEENLKHVVIDLTKSANSSIPPERTISR
ncbi:MAG: peptidylprolyl isomerase [Deltaproteobacteria bacterium]|nr:peptidylprolyl isomerase [Deltaproteobacteria bacterium]